MGRQLPELMGIARRTENFFVTQGHYCLHYAEKKFCLSDCFSQKVGFGLPKHGSVEVLVAFRPIWRSPNVEFWQSP